MLNFFLSYHWLRWSPPAHTHSPHSPSTLPPDITYHAIPTPSGPLELLSTHPQTHTSNTPLFFLHGGMGHARLWLPYMRFFASRGIPCYAVSLRGHGASWHPGYLRMVFGTGKETLAQDAAEALRWVAEREGGEVVLVGHSSGGGLGQLMLGKNILGGVRIRGLVLLGAVPGFGSMGVYMNWARFDPWFMLRMFLQGCHPNSPLSHPALTKRAFFSNAMPDADVIEFQKLICPYESFIWPWSMMRPFAAADSIVQNIAGWGSSDRLLVMAGGGDKLMTFPVMSALASTYRSAVASLVGQKKLEAKLEPTQKIEGAGGLDDAGNGVRFCIVPKAGHHVQNDVQWEVGAQKLLEFYNQL